MTFTPPKLDGPRESWWIGLSREQFYQRIAIEDATRFRLQTKNIGSFQTPGPMRVTRPSTDRTWDE